MIKKIKDFFLFWLKNIVEWLKKRSLPGFHGYPIYNVGVFFVRGLSKGNLGIRAGGVAFNFFMSLFPLIIFFFTLIPYIPIENFQQELLHFLNEVLPNEAYALFNSTIEDVVVKQRGDLLSIGIIMMLFFSSNGIKALIHAFNATYHSFETRSLLNRRLISIGLVLILTVLLTAAVGLITLSDFLVSSFVSSELLSNSWISFSVNLIKWIIVIALFFFSTSFLYFLGPSRKNRFRFISPGASLATIIQIFAILGFSYYLKNFAQYNKLYGSIGTIMIVLLLLYITAYALIIGFELNASIKESDRLRPKWGRIFKNLPPESSEN
ncbi:MAG: YihY/virulence factor BrkB family protein [Bacteroidales bacterium]|nr:YihY/virulence factor BrkB family protein [Bacteroidales bacterium]